MLQMSKTLKIQCTEYNTVNFMHVEDVEDYTNSCFVISYINVEDIEDI